MSNALLGFSLTTLIIAGSLSDCSNLSRYQNEIYECSKPSAPFERVTFEKVALGKIGKVTGTVPRDVTITFANKKIFNADWGKSELSINRETGAVSIIKNGTLRTHACKVMKFRM